MQSWPGRKIRIGVEPHSLEESRLVNREKVVRYEDFQTVSTHPIRIRKFMARLEGFH